MKKTYYLLSVLVLSTLSFSGFSQQQKEKRLGIKYGDNFKVGNYFSSGDIKLYYETYGRGKPRTLAFNIKNETTDNKRTEKN